MTAKRIPGLVISETDYELLRHFAHDHRINGISEAVRYLIRLSPQLQTYAETKGLCVEFAARPWGGARKKRIG
jgi:hypothetical protein